MEEMYALFLGFFVKIFFCMIFLIFLNFLVLILYFIVGFSGSSMDRWHSGKCNFSFPLFDKIFICGGFYGRTPSKFIRFKTKLHTFIQYKNINIIFYDLTWNLQKIKGKVNFPNRIENARQKKKYINCREWNKEINFGPKITFFPFTIIFSASLFCSGNCRWEISISFLLLANF
jgi:hypothetical protein